MNTTQDNKRYYIRRTPVGANGSDRCWSVFFSADGGMGMNVSGAMTKAQAIAWRDDANEDDN